MDLKEIGCDGMDWIDLDESDQWRPLVNMGTFYGSFV
jgi:hypothetical protein